MNLAGAAEVNILAEPRAVTVLDGDSVVLADVGL